MLISQDQVDRFPWGPVVEVHSIGEYDVIEFHPQIFKNCCGTGKYDYDRTMFHPYREGKDTNRSYHALDQALVGTIALKYDDLNSQAASYFFKMVGM